ncbi:hypothetical protein GCM10028801_30710 [Nocardioides maradonensis]
MTETRVCKICGVGQPITNFNFVSKDRRKRRWQCKGCQNAQNRARAARRRDALAAGALKPATSKTCRACKRHLPASEFNVELLGAAGTGAVLA